MAPFNFGEKRLFVKMTAMKQNSANGNNAYIQLNTVILLLLYFTKHVTINRPSASFIVIFI